MAGSEGKLILKPAGDFVTDVANWLRAPIPERCSIPERMALLSALSLLAASLSRRVWVTSPRGRKPACYPNLYVLFIGPTAVGKSDCIKNVGRLMRAVPDLTREQLRIIDGHITSSGLYTALVDGQKNGKHANLWVLQDEIGLHWGMDKFAKQLVRSLTAKFHGEAEGDATRTTGDFAIAEGYCINWLGGTTADWMQGMITRVEVKGGFLGRVLFMEAERIPEWRYGDEDTDPTVAAGLTDRVAEYLTWEGELPLTDEVKAWLKEWFYARPYPDTDDDFAHRDFEMLLKLLTLSAVSRGLHTPSTYDCERAAHWLGHREIPKCLAVTGPIMTMRMAAAQDTGKAQLARAIQAQTKPITREDLERSLCSGQFGFPRHDIAVWLEQLLAEGAIKLISVPVSRNCASGKAYIGSGGPDNGRQAAA